MKKLLSILVLLSPIIKAQDNQVDRVLRQVVAELKVAEGESTGKCGTPMIFEARRRMGELSPGLQQSLAAVLQRPVRQKSRLSPSGRFRVHYDTTGVHQPASLVGSPATRVPNSHESFVDSVGAIFDHCWDVEVNGLGFDAPPGDGIAGGGPEYDVYIESLSVGVFGFTSWGTGEIVFETGNRERTTTHIVIDNDFLGYRTEGWNGLRVTAAHEFHHAIQVGAYGIWNSVPNSDFYFYELTSVWMEDAVYDNINDYYFDLPLFFVGYQDVSNRSYSFTEFSPGVRAGYERSVFAHFLEKKFGRDIVRSLWKRVLAMPVLRAADDALLERGSSLATAFSEFATWNLFTGGRADTIRYYDEGLFYPVIAVNVSVPFGGVASRIQSSAFPFSIQYYRFDTTPDTVLAVVVNKNFEDAYRSPGTAASLSLVLSNSTPQGGVQQLKSGLKTGLLVQTPDDWTSVFLSAASLSSLRSGAIPFPNPLNLSLNNALILPVDGSSGNGDVFLLSSSLDLVFSGRYPVEQTLGKEEVRVPVIHLRPGVSTGIYFVVVKTPEKEFQWKIAVIR